MTKGLRQIIVLILLMACMPVLSAKSVFYIHKALSLAGCIVHLRVSKQEANYFIVAIVESDRLHFLSEPTMKVITFKDEILTFPGSVVTDGSSNYGIMIGTIMVSDIHSIAQFCVTPDDFEKLKDGIARIRFSMTPNNHDHSFTKDRIGKNLYRLYLKAKEEDNFSPSVPQTRRSMRNR